MSQLPRLEDQSVIVVAHPVWGWIKLVAVGTTLPLVLIYYTPLCLLQLARVLIARMRHSVQHAGSDSALSIDETAGLVALPVIALISAFGTSFGFYWLSISAPGDRDIGNSGWTAIVLSLELAIGAVIGFGVLLVRHRSGRSILPFERSVDPEKGIEHVRNLRKQASGLFPGSYYSAFLHVNEKLQQQHVRDDSIKRGPQDPSFKCIKARLVATRTDQRQWHFMFTMTTAWIVFPCFVGVNSYWLYCILGLIASTSIVYLATWISAVSYYYDQYNWAKREMILEGRIGAPSLALNHFGTDGRLDDRLQAILNEIRVLNGNLQIKVDSPGPRLHPINLLVIVIALVNLTRVSRYTRPSNY